MITVFCRVFIDDFINAIAGPPDRPTRQHQLLWVSRATLHAIHALFPPPEVLLH